MVCTSLGMCILICPNLEMKKIEQLCELDVLVDFIVHGLCLFCRHVHGKRVLVVTNSTVAPIYLDKVVGALTNGNPNVSVESVILPDGEKYKNMVCFTRFCLMMISLKSFWGIMMVIMNVVL